MRYPFLGGITGWVTEVTGEQRRTLLAASLGWMLDSMDVMIYALVLGAVQREMHLSAAMSGAMMSATLISAAVGGLGFGWFADRFGRVRALSLSILGYSVATAMCGFTHTAWQLMACRILLGLGMGGEWASGAALVAETWPARHRGKALARSLAPTLLVVARPQRVGGKPALAGGQPVLPVWHGQLSGQPGSIRPLALGQPGADLGFGTRPPHLRHRDVADLRAGQLGVAYLPFALHQRR